MTFFGKIFAALGHLFTNLAKEAEKTYNSLPEDVQKSLMHGSGVIAVINSMLDAAPKEIIAAIQKKFPDINILMLEENLFMLITAFGIHNNVTVSEVNVENIIETYIDEIKEYLHQATQNNKVWEGVSFAVSSLLAILFAPPETKFAAISSLLEYVYHAIVKPKVAE